MKRFSTRRFGLLAAILATPLALVLLLTTLGALVPDARMPGPAPLQWRYIHSGAFGHFDHEVYYYDIGGVMEQVRKADVLFLGTSRSLFALDSRTLDAATQSTGLRFHNLSFPFRESMRFPLKLLEMRNIRDKVIIVEADDAFFADPMGAYASAVTTRGRLSSLARILYNTAKYRLLLRLDAPVQAVAGFRPSEALLYSDKVLYRSKVTGAWFTDYFPVVKSRIDISEAVREGEQGRLTAPRVVEGARLLVRTLNDQGCRVIFLRVPYPKSPAQSQVRDLAAQVGAEFMEAPLSEADLRDGEHLTGESAEVFTRCVLERLTRLLDIRPRTDE